MCARCTMFLMITMIRQTAIYEQYDYVSRGKKAAQSTCTLGTIGLLSCVLVNYVKIYFVISFR